MGRGGRGNLAAPFSVNNQRMGPCGMEAQNTFVNWSHLQGQFTAAFEANLDKMRQWVEAHQSTLEAARWLGLGYHKEKKAITWPERDAEGEIVGIGCRAMDSGRKWMITGSKHGLIYAPDPEWGGVPKFVDHPILILEGATDVLACLAREIYAIGRPSAKGTVESNAWLERLVKDQKIALVCENDQGIGAVAFLDFAEPLARKAQAVYAVYPPANVKDMREWFKADPDAVLEINDQIRFRRPWSDDPGLIAVGGDVLRDTAPLRIADQMVKEVYTHLGESTLRYWNGLWYKFFTDHYSRIDLEYIRADVYRWLDTKKVMEKEKGAEGQWIEKPFNPTMQKVTQIIDALKARQTVLVPPETSMPCWLDDVPGRPSPRDMIAFENGILNVETYLDKHTLEFIPATPAWFSANHCPYPFNPADVKDAQPFIDYLRDILEDDEESIRLLQEWGFYCMTPDTRLEKLMMFVGRPSAGKGTVMDVLAKVIGEANIYYSRIDDLGSRFGLYGALGKTNIFMTDAHVSNVERATSSLEVIKTITGRGAINVEGKGINSVSLLLNIKFTISVNEMPNFQDTAAALRRRLNIIWFPKSFEGKADPDLKDRLCNPKTIRGVAAWFMEGGRRLRRNRKFTEPAISKAVAREFERTNTPVSAFVMEECRVGKEFQVEKKKLYSFWSEWCREKGMSPGNMASFGQKLVACLPQVRSGKAPRDHHGYRAPVYVGIRPRTQFDPEEE